MSVETAKRIIWRLQELNKPEITQMELRRAIMFEAGTDQRTIQRNINILLELKFLKRVRKRVFVFGTDDY